MKKSALKLFITVACLGAAILILGVIFFAVFIAEDNVSDIKNIYLNSSFVNSETVYMMLVFLFALLIGLGALLFSVIYSMRSAVKKQTARRKRAKRLKKEKKSAPRFPGLAAIDKAQAIPGVSSYSSCALDELCRRFRDYSASELGLYYDIADIRRFIAGMGMSKLIILRGMSGTGKTSLAYAAGEFFENPSTVVPIQPMWKERSDMIGYFNEFTKKFNETTMLCKLYEAGGRGEVYITVLDEVNISRIEYYFAEFLSLLEIPNPSRRYLDVVSDRRKNDPKRLKNGKLLLPDNMWFVGTANNDDSTFAISDKVYDRAAVIDLEKRSAPFDAKSPVPCRISCEKLNLLFEQAKKTYSLSGKGREKIAELDSYLRRTFQISFGNRIMKQIETYVPIMLACGGSEDGALDDIISRKILRKLEQISPAYVKSRADELTSYIDRLFGSGAMKQSLEYVEKLSKGF